jgi:hypothetical protein
MLQNSTNCNLGSRKIPPTNIRTTPAIQLCRLNMKTKPIANSNIGHEKITLLYSGNKRPELKANNSIPAVKNNNPQITELIFTLFRFIFLKDLICLTIKI